MGPRALAASSGLAPWSMAVNCTPASKVSILIEMRVTLAISTERGYTKDLG